MGIESKFNFWFLGLNLIRSIVLDNFLKELIKVWYFKFLFWGYFFKFDVNILIFKNNIFIGWVNFGNFIWFLVKFCWENIAVFFGDSFCCISGVLERDIVNRVFVVVDMVVILVKFKFKLN